MNKVIKQHNHKCGDAFTAEAFKSFEIPATKWEYVNGGYKVLINGIPALINCLNFINYIFEHEDVSNEEIISSLRTLVCILKIEDHLKDPLLDHYQLNDDSLFIERLKLFNKIVEEEKKTST